MKISVRKIAFSGVIAALYAGMTIAIMPFSYGPVQLRISEVLCILPFFFPFSVWGLFVGCIAANILSPYPLDVIVGPIASLIAALCTMYIGRSAGRDKLSIKALACFPPVIFNAILIGAMIAYIMVSEGAADAFMPAFVSSGLWVGLGQLIVLYALGLPLMMYLPKTKIIDKLKGIYDSVK
ncbi:MAG: QueT transporter family protein [Oscillospiraceae bacterium]|jgi:uncharacterized membrane protein|nr:QueT transporter family protein [Oscillospiraceae bacterium]